MVKQTSDYMVQADSKEAATAHYRGKRFLVQNSPAHIIEVEVTHVEIVGGYVLPFAKLIRTVKADKHNKTVWGERGKDREQGEWIYPGKLQAIGGSNN